MTTQEEVNKQQEARALKLKDVGGQRFQEGEYTAALTVYAAALQLEALSKPDAAKVHANMAACLLKLGGEERAPKALRAAVEAYELDPTYGKAFFRASQALEILGEAEAAAEAKAKADELIAAEKAATKAKNDKLRAKWAAKKEREEKLAAERAKEEYNNTHLASAPVQPFGSEEYNNLKGGCGSAGCADCN